MKNYELLTFANADELAHAAATTWRNAIEAANLAGKMHCVALSGGRITQKFFASVVEQDRVGKISYKNVHFFWADERCVPPSDPESNFKMADELLFKPLKIAADNIHRLRGELLPEEAVKIAEAELRRVTAHNSDNQSVLDLIFLGMGEDGHIASLFPNSSENFLDTAAPFLVIKNSPKPPPTRISLGYKTILAAKNIAILVSGAGKEAAFRESISPDGKTPLARVLQGHPVKIFSDIKIF
ncbi:MAG TPA: 6-phosphogluconolactonase [Candidatus Sulfotelmatobacter sp.]|jgi:6-phosphogluconolactonase|nr:6-phosphogluconolactonase [Candidatus Sulfotelmatobacter sp.]